MCRGLFGMAHLIDIDRHDIENYGMTHIGTASGSTEKDHRAAEYRAHCTRLLVDEDYRKSWEENEKTWIKAQQKHNI